ncbi:ECF transporter S component [Senegalia massiliensis]|uniref:ECF transporter S component n=1 Tax=Senegalia massiliensis TaxID=1720316 RepID=A0A845QX60_9CLOT|nr:ECF transporter S component [Senegalia massiliensis]NBI06574.1 ECF transporter S component [Senegalia massiliensis]
MQISKNSKYNLSKTRLFFSILILFIAIPIIITIGVKLFNDRKYNLISIIIAFLSCLPFFIRFESRKPQTREIMVIVVMASISATSRVIFAPLPGFKPVTAITAITGIAFGPEAGFLTGSISALVSNMFFGQGPWTPFQMISWGLLGFIAGLLTKFNLMKNKIVLIIYSIFAGVLFSLMMDIWFVVSVDGLFTLERYKIAILAAVPFTIEYVISNIFFLLLLNKPIGEKLERIKIKYGLIE